MAKNLTHSEANASALRMSKCQTVLQTLRAGESLSPRAMSQPSDTLSWLRGSQEKEE